MKKKHYSGLLIFFILPVMAQESDMGVLIKLNAKFIHNFVTNDTASHSLIIHKDFICISSEGQYMERKEGNATSGRKQINITDRCACNDPIRVCLSFTIETRSHCRSCCRLRDSGYAGTRLVRMVD